VSTQRTKHAFVPSVQGRRLLSKPVFPSSFIKCLEFPRNQEESKYETVSNHFKEFNQYYIFV
jgi:hypothetical protein